MFIEVLKSKLHCVTVTEANLNYMGSITIDEDLMDAANMIAGERVQIVDGDTLQPVASWDASPYIVGCITVYCGHTPIRLIDHIKYKE
jgi:hypothetical protein